MANYIPRSDAEFNNWQDTRMAYVKDKSEPWHISQEEITALGRPRERD